MGKGMIKKLFTAKIAVAAILAALGVAGYQSDELEWVRDGVSLVEKAGASGLDSLLPEKTGFRREGGQNGAEAVSEAPSGGNGRAESAWKSLFDDGKSRSDGGRNDKRQVPSKRSYTGRVTSVADGDTLRVTDSDGQKHKIRLAYIDAPEIQQAYGEAARDSLRDMADGKTVAVTVFERDRYRREVAKVEVDGKDLNLAQLRRGAAWHYTSYAAKKQDGSDYAGYAAAMKKAHAGRVGLWKKTDPQEPWNFRKQQREQQENSGKKNRDSGMEWLRLW
ncbi:thermonuclease family protein [Neisseria sp.]|uniref:thermonuclease family protein n=1 Tax=Neisseria sp. TaxID=192066 RepID=UPI00359FA9EB